MDQNEILLTLFSETTDQKLVKFKIIDSFHKYSNQMSIESFFYQYEFVIEKVQNDFEETRKERVKGFRKSIEFNNVFYVNETDKQKYEMNKHNLSEIKIAESEDYRYSKVIGYDSLGEPIWLNVNKSQIESVSGVIKEIKQIILESSKYNKRLRQNKFENIFRSDLSYSIFYHCYERFKNENDKRGANYSFLFYKMEKLLICNGTDFKQFLLDEYKIEVKRLDTTKINTPRKSEFYDAVVNRLLYDI